MMKLCNLVWKFYLINDSSCIMRSRPIYSYKETIMNFNPPKKVTWYISVILGVVGLLGFVLGFQVIGLILLAVGWLLIVLANVVKGL